MTPEAQDRHRIDERLTQAGWVVQDMKRLNLGAALEPRSESERVMSAIRLIIDV